MLMMRSDSNSGFTLIELMIVVAIIAIIAAIALPNLLRSRMAANEANAIGNLRSISTAETQFQAVAAGGFVNGSATYGTLTQMRAATPPFIDAVLGADPAVKSGYVFVAVPNTPTATTAAAFTATASRQGANSGNRSFLVSTDGVVRAVQGDGPATTDSPPIQ